jgi:peptidoglycan hydrolase CwlO-like protein
LFPYTYIHTHIHTYIHDSLEASQANVAELSTKLEEVSDELNSTQASKAVAEKEVERLVAVIEVGRARFNALTEEANQSRLTAETTVEELSRCRSRLANAEIKLAQARKQCQTLQMQNGMNGAGGGGNEDSGGVVGGANAKELQREVERLSSELTSMTAKCEDLRAQVVQVGGCSGGMTPSGPYHQEVRLVLLVCNAVLQLRR